MSVILGVVDLMRTEDMTDEKRSLSSPFPRQEQGAWRATWRLCYETICYKTISRQYKVDPGCPPKASKA